MRFLLMKYELERFSLHCFCLYGNTLHRDKVGSREQGSFYGVAFE